MRYTPPAQAARQGTRGASVEELREKRIREIVREEIDQALVPIKADIADLKAKVDALLKHFEIRI